MRSPKHLVLGAFLLGAAGVALAQAAPPSQSTDPFVQRRNEKTEAKKEYKSGEISKEQYKEDSAEAKEKLKATGERGYAEQNLEVPAPAQGGGMHSSGK